MEGAMRQRIQKYNIPIWYLTTLIFTGGLLCLHFIWKSAGNYSVSFTQFGPMLTTFLLIYIGKDKNALRKIQNGLFFRIQDIVFYIWAAITSFALIGISSFLLGVIFNSPYLAWNGTPIFYFLNFMAMLLGSIGEEIGWRGYLLPVLNKRFTPFFSSILVGCLWGFWHLNYAGDIIFWLIFIMTTVELSIIFTFFLYKTNGNLWTAIILHTFFNLANRVFVWGRFNINLLLTEMILFGLICVVVVAVNKGWMFHKKVTFPKGKSLSI